MNLRWFQREPSDATPKPRKVSRDRSISTENASDWLNSILFPVYTAGATSIHIHQDRNGTGGIVAQAMGHGGTDRTCTLKHLSLREWDGLVLYLQRQSRMDSDQDVPKPFPAEVSGDEITVRPAFYPEAGRACISIVLTLEYEPSSKRRPAA